MRRWQAITTFLLALILAGPLGCSPLGGQDETGPRFVEVKQGDLTITVNGSGNIVFSNEANLTFGSGGRVDKIYVEEGDEVSKGRVLASLDTAPLELALAQAQSALDQAEYNLEQVEEPYSRDDIDSAKAAERAAEDALEYAKWQLDQAKDADDEDLIKQWEAEVSRAEANLLAAEIQLEAMLDAPDEGAVEAAESQLEAAEQALAVAQKQLDEAIITAPFDGVIASINVEEGDTVAATITIIHLVDPHNMELEVEVDEIDIPSVRLNQRAIIEVDALPDAYFEGTVTSIAPLSIEEGGVVLYEVKIGLSVPEGSELRTGMSADADIVINERTNVLLVPSRAVTKDNQGNPVVTVVVDEETEERPVVIGISDGFDTEIITGLSVGEVVIVE